MDWLFDPATDIMIVLAIGPAVKEYNTHITPYRVQFQALPARLPTPARVQRFEPSMTEALQKAPAKEHRPMTVQQEFERGYQMYDRVVRPTKVIVSVAPAE